jgi:hypothetical protein
VFDARPVGTVVPVSVSGARGIGALWRPRRAEPGRWLLRSLVRCGPCGVITKCLKTVSGRPRRTPSALRYYVCPHRDPLRAGGEDLRCREHGIRADELDVFVFAQVRDALLQPEVLLAGESALASRTPAPDDELLTAQLGRLNRRLEAAEAERRRLVDVYQTGLLQLAELETRTREVDDRRRRLAAERDELTAQRQDLVQDNRLRLRVSSFADRVVASLDDLDFNKRQQLLRLVVEEVRVTGWQVEIRLRIPLDEAPADPQDPPALTQRGSGPAPPNRVSSKDGLRLLRTTPVAETAGWVFGIDEARATLGAALGRLRSGPEVASQPGTLPAGTRAGKLVGPGSHEEPEAPVATDVHVRVSVRGRSRSRTVAVARSM